MNHVTVRKTFVALTLALLAVFGTTCAQGQGNNPSPAFEGKYVATDYNYGGPGPNTPNALIIDSGGTGSSGAQTYTLRVNSFISLPRLGGRLFMPLNVNAPILIDGDPVTPSAVSCTTPSVPGTCSITATVAAAHGAGSRITSGTFGLQEAINDAWQSNGGLVVIDPYWVSFGGTTTIIAAATVYGNVSIENRGATVDKNGVAFTPFYNIGQTAATMLGVPTVLSGTTAVFSTTPAGLYTTANAYFMCVSYVDVAGQEGACSTTFSQTPATTLSSLAVTAPVASTGAVGYTIYISLTNGTYSLAYQVPLTSAVCVLTKVETVTPACAVANATYSQAAANAVVTALTINTSPVDMQTGGVSGTLLTGNAGGRTVYSYVGSAKLNNTGIPTNFLAFTVGGIGSATPISIGTINIPASFMNQVSRTLRVCGQYLNTDVNSSTQIANIYWDAAASNVAGSPVKVTNLVATGTGTAAPYEGRFCENITTTVSSATGTGGSLLPGNGLLNYALISTGNVVGTGMDTLAAAVTTINLAGTGSAALSGFSNRISIIHNNATGNATPQLQSLTIELL